MAGRAASGIITRYAGIQVQTSTLGTNIPVGWGTFRCRCNLVDYLDFKSSSTKAAAGKGGSNTTGYSYAATIILAVCEGPIENITQVWVNGKRYAHGSNGSGSVDTGTLSATAQLDLSFSLGTIGQAPWSYLVSNHPDHAIGYSGLVIVFDNNYPLDNSASTPNHSFEVVRQASFAVGGGYTGPDIDPSLMLADFFQNTRTGVPSWGVGLLDGASLTTAANSYRKYCLAAGLLLSPVIDQQLSASDALTEYLRATNSTVVWSEGLLKFIPYGDTALSGAGVTYTPNLTPIYALNDDAFIVKTAGDPPLLVDIEDQSDAYNVIQLEYLDRANQYNMAIALASDAANVAQFGMRRKDPDTVHCICTPSVAAISAQLYLQRTLYIRAKYKFDLSWAFALLEPGDIVELTDAGLGLSAYPVRIIQIDEDEKAVLSLTCEDLLVGVSHAPLYTMQTGAGTQTNQNVDPGGVEANLMLWSQDWTNAAWTKVRMTITAAATTNPVTAATDAQQWAPAATSGQHLTAQSVTLFAGANYTSSIYVEANGYHFVRASLFDNASGDEVYVDFDITAGTILTPVAGAIAGQPVAASIVSAGGAWWRISVTGRLPNLTTTAGIRFFVMNAAFNGPSTGIPAYTGSGSAVYAWGADVTQGVDVRPYAVTTAAIAGPQIFAPPAVLTQAQGARETWAALAGGAFWGGANVWVSLDGGAAYELIGSTQNGPARFGQLTAAYASHADPDTTDTLSVDLSMSQGALTSAADAVADQSGTLCLVDGTELVSFSTATLTNPNRYNLTTYLRRGALGTPISAHAAGAQFIRLDSAIFDFPFFPTMAGKTVLVKFQSFNQWGQAATPLTNCPAYAFVPTTYGSTTPGASAWSATGGALSNGGQSVPAIIITGASDNAAAQLIAFYYKPSGAGAWLNGGTGPNSTTLHNITAVAPSTAYDIGVAYVINGAPGSILTIATGITTGAIGSGSSAAPGQVLFDSHVAGAWSYTCQAGTYGHVDIEAWGADGGNYETYFGPGDISATESGGAGSYSLDAGVAATPGTTAFAGTIGGAGVDGGYPHGVTSGTAGANTTVTTPAITTHGGAGATSSANGAGGAAGSGGTTNTAGAAGGAADPPSNGRIRITART